MHLRNYLTREPWMAWLPFFCFVLLASTDALAWRAIEVFNRREGVDLDHFAPIVYGFCVDRPSKVRIKFSLPDGVHDTVQLEVSGPREYAFTATIGADFSFQVNDADLQHGQSWQILLKHVPVSNPPCTLLVDYVCSMPPQKTVIPAWLPCFKELIHFAKDSASDPVLTERARVEKFLTFQAKVLSCTLQGYQNFDPVSVKDRKRALKLIPQKLKAIERLKQELSR